MSRHMKSPKGTPEYEREHTLVQQVRQAKRALTLLRQRQGGRWPAQDTLAYRAAMLKLRRRRKAIEQALKIEPTPELATMFMQTVEEIRQFANRRRQIMAVHQRETRMQAKAREDARAAHHAVQAAARAFDAAAPPDSLADGNTPGQDRARLRRHARFAAEDAALRAQEDARLARLREEARKRAHFRPASPEELAEKKRQELTQAGFYDPPTPETLEKGGKGT